MTPLSVYSCRKVADPSSVRTIAAENGIDAPEEYVISYFGNQVELGAVVFVAVDLPGGVFPRTLYWRVECISTSPLGFASTRTNMASALQELKRNGVKM